MSILPVIERCGNWPVWSVNILPVVNIHCVYTACVCNTGNVVGVIDNDECVGGSIFGGGVGGTSGAGGGVDSIGRIL